MSFEEFGLSPNIMSGLADLRIEKPTPLQNEVIPSVLQGNNMLVKTESDDDGVFLIPALQKLTTYGEVSGTKVLILTPSIERAKALDETVWAMGYHAQISSASLSMKGNREEQEQAIKDGAPVVIANPGRLIEILDKNKLKLSHVDLVVIDEAHGMENYNLVSRVKDIMKLVESDPQVLIFSESNNKATQQLT
ncbi:MAG TPA: DEAD/DEAH box helicase, partial [Gracilimonas sp.]|nr:DEAD/DEAH box helicase [Gracilimonas sp.]